jgi:hypothetical protein
MANVTATQLIYQAARDIGVQWANVTPSPDKLNDCLVALNELMDQWAIERLFVYKTDKTILAAFADLTTAYNLAPGYAAALRANLAVLIAPMLQLYLKTKPEMDSIMADAVRTKNALYGVGVA